MPTSFPGAPMHIYLACQDLNDIKKNSRDQLLQSRGWTEISLSVENMEDDGAVGISQWMPGQNE